MTDRERRLARALTEPYYWVPVEPDGSVCTETFTLRRSDAIATLQDGTGLSWRYLYRKGWRIVKVRIIPFGPPP